MAERHEVEAWVNPSAWDDQADAQRAIDEILESGSEDEAEWVRIAGGDEADQAAAAERDGDRAEQAVEWELSAFRVAERALDHARDELHDALRRAMDDGVSAYRLAQVTGLSERHIGRIRAQR